MDFDMGKWMAAKRSGEVLIEHLGDFSSSYIDSVLPRMEQKLHDNISSENIRKRTFHIFIECVQNLYHHVEPSPSVRKAYGADKLGVIVMAKENAKCRITTGNFVPVEKAADLQRQIDYLNSLAEGEIKDLYRKTVSTKDFSEKGGAGLGMIDMARKSGNKLGCNFYTVKGAPGLRFFSFDVCIG